MDVLNGVTKYRPKHFNSTGGISGSVITAGGFAALYWMWPDVTPAPPEVVVAVNTLACWLASQVGRLRIGYKTESRRDGK